MRLTFVLFAICYYKFASVFTVATVFTVMLCSCFFTLLFQFALAFNVVPSI